MTSDEHPERKMNRDVAIRLDGMVMGAQGNLDGIAHYMKNNLPPDDYAKYIRSIGQAMGELMDISSSLHARFPGITPCELLPPGK